MTLLRNEHQALLDSIPQSGLKCDILFLVIKNRIQEEPEYVKKMRVVFQFNISKHGKQAATWTSDTRTSIEGDIYRSLPKNGLKVDCVLSVDDDDFVRIMVGRLNPQRAFMMGKFKIRGNIMLLQKLHALWYELRRKGKTPEIDIIQNIMVDEQLVPGLKSEAMAFEIVQRIVKSPHLIDLINANIQYNIVKQGKLVTQYLIGMHPGEKPDFTRLYNPLTAGKKDESQSVPSPPKPDVILTVDDDDFVLIIYGIMKLDDAIKTGRLLVDGNHDVVSRTRALFDHQPIMHRL